MEISPIDPFHISKMPVERIFSFARVLSSFSFELFIKLKVVPVYMTFEPA